jgi:hypothetical protein
LFSDLDTWSPKLFGVFVYSLGPLGLFLIAFRLVICLVNSLVSRGSHINLYLHIHGQNCVLDSSYSLTLLTVLPKKTLLTVFDIVLHYWRCHVGPTILQEEEEEHSRVVPAHHDLPIQFKFDLVC